MFAEADRRFRYFVALFRCDVATPCPATFVCGEMKVELFREDRTYLPAEYQCAVVAGVLGAEYCLPVHPPIVLDSKCQHLVLSTRTKQSRSEAQPYCEAEIDRGLALLAALYSPDLFRTPLFRGWLRGGPPSPDLGLLVKGVDPIVLQSSSSPGKFSAALGAVAKVEGLQGRFDLMSRLVAKGFAEAPGEESFLWLWTALEVFPMVGTTDIQPIPDFLSSYFGRPAVEVKTALRIGWLFGMRSKLVHDGHLPLAPEERFLALSRLEQLVLSVLRHAASLPYDGALDKVFGHA